MQRSPMRMMGRTRRFGLRTGGTRRHDVVSREGDVMHPGGLPESARNLARARLRTFLGLALLATVAATGCGGSGQQPPGTATKTRATACGMAKTAADVPVRVEVVRGHLACTRAMTVAAAYATAVRSGRA